MIQIREKALAFAVSHYLTFYPENTSFEDIIYRVRENDWVDDELEPWEYYQDCAGEWIADQIELMACLLEATFS